MKTEIQVPGKLFVAGEYAVTLEGNYAIVAAIETAFSVTVTESDRLRLHTNAGLAGYKPGINDEDWRFALAALEYFPHKNLDIYIQSDLGLGADKKGYGSSASVVAGLINHLDLPFTARLRYAMAAHRQAQGSGSMGDVAAIMAGGIILYQNPDIIKHLNFPWEAYVIRTGESVKTDEKLAISFDKEFYKKSNELVLQIAEARDFLTFKQRLLANQQLLIDNLPAGYVTEKLAEALETINTDPHLVGKISGAGFGENLIVFADQPITGLEKINIAKINV